ncbi:MAG: hypothetical protein R3C14_00595 [Caldilineaceae bacterium]
MSDQVEVLITFILYIAFFAWIGYQRGAKREGIVLVVAVGAWIALQEGGNILVRIANLGGKFVAFVKAGGLGENPDAAFGALKDAPQWVTADQRGTFLFLIWGTLLLLTYIVTQKVLKADKKEKGWAMLFGMLNGLFYGAVFLPKLLILFQPVDNGVGATAGRTGVGGLLDVFRSGFRLLGANLGELWNFFEPSQRSLVLLVLLTTFLLLVASTVRGSGSRKSKSRSSDSQQSNTNQRTANTS